MSYPNKKKGIAATVLGIISFGLLLAPGFFALLLIAFAPSSAWLPLLPSMIFSLIGLAYGIYTKKRIGIVLNSTILVIILLFLIFMFYRISIFVPQVF